MIETIFTFESSRSRQRAAPLLQLREDFLAYLHREGIKIQRLRSIAGMLLQIIRIMNLTEPRIVEASEIVYASRRWELDPAPIHGRDRKSSESFAGLAKRWLRFSGLIGPTSWVQSENECLIQDFVTYLKTERMMVTATIRNYKSRSHQFLRWMSSQKRPLATARRMDVDDYLKHCQQLGWKPRTIASVCAALRAFFRYLERLYPDHKGIAVNIEGPKVQRYSTAPKGPEWRDVRRMLDQRRGQHPADLRGDSVLALSAIYGMRSSEIAGLLLRDFDWFGETLTIRRSKTGRIQQFPLQYEVGEAVLGYLRHGRPRCACRNLFVTLNPPYRPMLACVTWTIISKRMKSLEVRSQNFGVHALRHACATELLRRGSNLRDIADFLGHRSMNSVSIYAKHDFRMLKQVAAFNLGGMR